MREEGPAAEWVAREVDVLGRSLVEDERVRALDVSDGRKEVGRPAALDLVKELLSVVVVRRDLRTEREQLVPCCDEGCGLTSRPSKISPFHRRTSPLSPTKGWVVSASPRMCSTEAWKRSSTLAPLWSCTRLKIELLASGPARTVRLRFL